MNYTGEQWGRMLDHTANFLDAHREVGCQSIHLDLATESPTIEVWIDLITNDLSLVRESATQPLRVEYDEGSILYAYALQNRRFRAAPLDPNRPYASDCVDALAHVVRALPLPILSVSALLFEGLSAAVPILAIDCQSSPDAQITQQQDAFLRDWQAIINDKGRPSIAARSQRHGREQMFSVKLNYSDELI